jgi:hypothetical protein
MTFAKSLAETRRECQNPTTGTAANESSPGSVNTGGAGGTIAISTLKWQQAIDMILFFGFACVPSGGSSKQAK